MFREIQREKLKNGEGDRKGKVEWYNSNTQEKSIFKNIFFINLFISQIYSNEE